LHSCLIVSRQPTRANTKSVRRKLRRLTPAGNSGEPAFDGINGTHLAMDNFTFESIPEPSSFLLAALGAVSLVAFLKRKRA
jgi:hypothetical protein